MSMTRQQLPTADLLKLIDRAGGCCERCGRWLMDPELPMLVMRGTSWSVQHRKAAGAGGTNDPEFNSPANVVLLCGSGTTRCHGEVESYKTLAKEDGWTVLQNADPPSIAVRLHGGRVAYLLPDWTYSWRDTAGAA